MPRPEGSGVKKGMKFNTKKKSVNAAILETFDRLGGGDGFVKWARGQIRDGKKWLENKNLLEFYRIFSRLASPVFDDPIDNGNGGSMTHKINIIVVSHDQKEMHDKISMPQEFEGGKNPRGKNSRANGSRV